MKFFIADFWKKTKIRPDIWLFFGFLLTFCFSVRKVWFYYPIEGTFNEYTGLYIYVSEIFLILAIGSWLFSLLSYKILSLSNSSSKKANLKSILAYIKQKTSSIFLSRSSLIHNLSWMLPLFLVFLSLLSILWSANQTIALYRSLKLFELYGLYSYIIFGLFRSNFSYGVDYQENVEVDNSLSVDVSEKDIVPRGTISGRRGTIEYLVKNLRLLFGVIIFLGFLQAVVGIWQFLLQHSLGLRFLRESIISPEITGVAKVVLDGERYIRAYGFMPHPNILGGFLVASILITWLYAKLFHLPRRQAGVEQFQPGMEQFHVEQFNSKKNQNLCGLFSGRLIFEKITRTTLSLARIYPHSTCSKENFGEKSLSQTMLFQKSARQVKNINCKEIKNDFGYHFFGDFFWFNNIRSLFRAVLRFCIFINMWLIDKKRLIKGLILIQLVALLVTFSKSAMIGLLIALIYIFVKSCIPCLSEVNPCLPEIVSRLPDVVPRGTICRKDLRHLFFSKLIYFGNIFTNVLKISKIRLRLFHARLLSRRIGQLRIIFLSVLILLFSFFIFMKPDLKSLFFQSLDERFFYLNVSRGTISENYFLGLGIGQFVLNMSNFSEKTIMIWQYQPVHNTFLLIWSEIGILGLFLFLGWIWLILKKDRFFSSGFEKRMAKEGQCILCHNNIELSIKVILLFFRGTLLAFLFIALFDHYFWDIWQGQVLFWLVAAMIVGMKKEQNKNNKLMLRSDSRPKI